MTDTPDTITREEADARVAAALGEAAEVVRHAPDTELAYGHLLDLIPDAGGALDRAIAEAVKAEREAVCRIIHDAITAGTISPRGGVLLQDAIRARTQEDGKDV